MTKCFVNRSLNDKLLKEIKHWEVTTKSIYLWYAFFNY